MMLDDDGHQDREHAALRSDDFITVKTPCCCGSAYQRIALLSAVTLINNYFDNGFISLSCFQGKGQHSQIFFCLLCDIKLNIF